MDCKDNQSQQISNSTGISFNKLLQDHPIVILIVMAQEEFILFQTDTEADGKLLVFVPFTLCLLTVCCLLSLFFIR